MVGLPVQKEPASYPIHMRVGKRKVAPVALQPQLQLVRLRAQPRDDLPRQIGRRALAQLLAGASEAEPRDGGGLQDRGGNDRRGFGERERIGHGANVEQTRNTFQLCRSPS